MKKRIVSIVMAITMTMSLCGVAGCSSTPNDPESASDSNSATNTNTNVAQGTGTESAFGYDEEIYYDPDLVPSIEPYKVADDFSNVVYHHYFDYMFDTSSEYGGESAAQLVDSLKAKNFAVKQDSFSEFFDVYESNRYIVFPSFVTVDSLMHTYHLYFSYLLKRTEKNYLSVKLNNISKDMLKRTATQYEALKGTDWEGAALNNLEFFYVGCLLLDDKITAPISDDSFNEAVQQELAKIQAADGIYECPLTGLNEDYSQYKPRGYYEGDEQLEKYFRAMMWYGRIAFKADSEEMVRCTVLMNAALSEGDADYNSVYDITSFFAGVSDDIGYADVKEILEKSYGKMPETSDLTSNAAAFQQVVTEFKSAKAPQINSIPVYEDEENVIPSYRFMGQRFTVDAAIMQQLIFRAVEENSQGQRRMLPDALDVPATLGSDTAMNILTEQGATDYKNYSENMAMMQETFNNSDPATWNASLYSGWLNTLRPLLEHKGEGYPSYMQSEDWDKKNLETFTGSYAELKHDTILYAKQVMAEMGGGEDEEIPDDRGYVDPQPVVYSRFVSLSNKTLEGLKGYGMIDQESEEDLKLLSEIAMRLLQISEKELKNESLSDDDYEYIRNYGGNLEHFWLKANQDDFDTDLVYAYQAPCPVIADIATDPNGTVLEVGSGKVDSLYVVFPIDGELHVARGAAYSFYQFTQPIENRLTDSQWRAMLEGGYLDDDWNWVESESAPAKPEWTMSYRIGG